MEMIVADQLIMGLIIYAGDAKSHIPSFVACQSR